MRGRACTQQTQKMHRAELLWALNLFLLNASSSTCLAAVARSTAHSLTSMQDEEEEDIDEIEEYEEPAQVDGAWTDSSK